MKYLLDSNVLAFSFGAVPRLISSSKLFFHGRFVDLDPLFGGYFFH